jgi:phosphopantothenoylcysteine decarboxylase/phosphopantothenate--cysteine ligase
VTLVTSAALPPPPAVTVIAVERAEEMLAAVAAACHDADVLIMAAAVADYRVAAPTTGKIKKHADRLTLDLVTNPDILATVRGDFVRVGFAAETENLLANAEEKLRAKGLDLIVANDVTAPDAGFGVDTNRVVLLSSEGTEALPLLSKREVADRILDRVVARLRARRA